MLATQPDTHVPGNLFPFTSANRTLPLWTRRAPRRSQAADLDQLENASAVSAARVGAVCSEDVYVIISRRRNGQERNRSSIYNPPLRKEPPGRGARREHIVPGAENSLLSSIQYIYSQKTKYNTRQATSQNPDVGTPRTSMFVRDSSYDRSLTIFGGVAGRYFMWTVVFHFLHSGFRWGGHWVMVGCCTGSRCVKRFNTKSLWGA